MMRVRLVCNDRYEVISEIKYTFIVCLSTKNNDHREAFIESSFTLHIRIYDHSSHAPA